MDENEKSEIVSTVLAKMTQALVPTTDKSEAARGYPGCIVQYTDQHGDVWPAVIVRVVGRECVLTTLQGRHGVGNATAKFSESGDTNTWSYYPDR